ncbi:MAG: hypothetical protein ACE5F6_14950 [Anaerolineae bacterium]
MSREGDLLQARKKRGSAIAPANGGSGEDAEPVEGCGACKVAPFDRLRMLWCPLANRTEQPWGRGKPALSLAEVSESRFFCFDTTNPTCLAVFAAPVHDLHGVDFLLTYDASAVEVIDTDLNRPGVQIELGPLFTGQPYFVAYNRATVDHRTGIGTISFVATLLNPAEPITGDGVIASVRYRVLESSVSPEALFTIEEVQLVS